MEDKKTSSPASVKRKQMTMLNAITQGLSLVLLISLVAWVLLMMWFAGKIFLGDHHMIKTLDIMNNYYDSFISNHYLPALKKMAYQIKSFIALIHDYYARGLGYLNIALNKANTRISMPAQQTMQTIEKVITGTLEITLLRLLIFIMSLPLFITLLYVFIVDGLGQRDIRKFQGSRESTFFFHWIKPMTGKIFFILFFIYMSIPFSLSPNLILLPMIILLSVMTMFAIKGYKKYV